MSRAKVKPANAAKPTGCMHGVALDRSCRACDEEVMRICGDVAPPRPAPRGKSSAAMYARAKGRAESATQTQLRLPGTEVA